MFLPSFFSRHRKSEAEGSNIKTPRPSKARSNETSRLKKALGTRLGSGTKGPSVPNDASSDAKPNQLGGSGHLSEQPSLNSHIRDDRISNNNITSNSNHNSNLSSGPSTSPSPQVPVKHEKPTTTRAVYSSAKSARRDSACDIGESISRKSHDSRTSAPSVNGSSVITLTVGKEGRVFAAHEDILCQAPFFDKICRGSPGPNGPLKEYTALGGQQMRRLHLPDDEPEVISAVLEYLYKGDYYPRLVPGAQRDSWKLEDSIGGGFSSSATVVPMPFSDEPNTPRSKISTTSSKSTTSRPEALIYMQSLDNHILRDTAIYCAADRLGLDKLKQLSLRKQGLQSGIDVATILRSAQFAYKNTPDSDSRLRAHYLALIIRCRRTFKRSGTLQAEMEKGGSKLYFDLFVALCNHLDDVVDASRR